MTTALIIYPKYFKNHLQTDFWNSKGFFHVRYLEVEILGNSPMALDSAEKAGVLDFISANSRHPFSVVLQGFSACQRLCPALIDLLASGCVSAILRFDEQTGNLLPHRPLENVTSHTLAVFPGSVLPLNLGSHRRIFQLCTNLLALDEPVDLLVTGRQGDVLKVLPLLEQVAPRVFHFGNKKPAFPAPLLWRRLLETSLEFIKGNKAKPYLFSERLLTKASFSGAKHLRRLVQSRRYRNVIVSYAWMDGVRRLVPPSLKKQIRWFCDTHDVQFVRNSDSGLNRNRLFTNHESEKKCEIEVLKSYDRVMAISSSDAEILQRELGKDRVLPCPNGFDYALMPPKPIDPERPVFGFIGRNMQANSLALKEILENWWPAIHSRWPRSVLRIAGGICDSEEFLIKSHIRSDFRIQNQDSSIFLYQPSTTSTFVNFKA